MNTAWTDNQVDVAVKAGAAAMYAQQRKALIHKAGADPEGWPEDFADLDPETRNRIVDVAIPIVWAALTALPDPRYAAWEEGLASADYDFEKGAIVPTTENPYPSGV